MSLIRIKKNNYFDVDGSTIHFRKDLYEKFNLTYKGMNIFLTLCSLFKEEIIEMVVETDLLSFFSEEDAQNLDGGLNELLESGLISLVKEVE